MIDLFPQTPMWFNIAVVWIILSFIIMEVLRKVDVDFIDVGRINIYTRTERGEALFKRISQKTRILDTFSWVGIFITAIFGVLGSIVILLLGYIGVTREISAPVQINPSSVVAIPGLNKFIPLTEAVPLLIGLIIVAGLHEIGHAVYAKYHGLEINSCGAIFTFLLPMGAFVDIDLDSLDKKEYKQKLDVITAGIGINFLLLVISIISLVLLSQFLTPLAGVHVSGTVESSPASETNLEKGDVVTEVDSESISSPQEFVNKSGEKRNITLTINNNRKVNLNRYIYVYQSYREEKDINAGDTIKSINGEKIRTIAEIRDTRHLNIRTSNKTINLTTGSRYALSSEKIVNIISVNGENIYNGDDIEKFIGEKVEAKYIRNSTQEVDTINITENKILSGYNGVLLRDIGITAYPAAETVEVLQLKNGDNIGEDMLLLTALPIATGNGVLISGFTNYYETPFNSSYGEYGFLFVISFLFWFFWMNLGVILLNALPIALLDGGHAFKFTMDKIIGSKKIVELEAASELNNISNVLYITMSLLLVSSTAVFLLQLIY